MVRPNGNEHMTGGGKAESGSPQGSPEKKKIPRSEFDALKLTSEKVEFVLKNKGDIPTILYAASVADEQTCLDLINSGVEVEAVDENGAGVLHYAAKNARHGLKLVDSLVRLGADAKKKDLRGADAVVHALRDQNFAFAAKLFEKHASEGSLLVHCAGESLALLRRLFESDACAAKARDGAEVDHDLLSEAAAVADLPTFQWLVDVSSSCSQQMLQDRQWLLRVLLHATRNALHGEAIAKHVMDTYHYSVSYDDFNPIQKEAEKQGNLGVIQARQDYIKETLGKEVSRMLRTSDSNEPSEILRQLLTMDTIKPSDALLFAAKTTNLVTCIWMVNEGVDLVANKKELATFFHCAVGNNTASEAAAIIRHFGPKLREHLNRINKDLVTPLQLALSLGRFDAAEALLEVEPALLGVKYLKKANLLLYCLGKNNLDGAKFVFAKDKSQIEGASATAALHIAEQYFNVEMKEWLTANIPSTSTKGDP